ATGKSLADVVIGLTDEVEGDTVREPRTKALPGGTLERQPDRILRQSGMPKAPRHLARQHGAGGAIPVANVELVLDPLLALQRWHGERDQPVIDHLVEAMVLPLAVVDGDVLWHLGLMEQLPKSRPRAFQWPIARSVSRHCD